MSPFKLIRALAAAAPWPLLVLWLSGCAAVGAQARLDVQPEGSGTLSYEAGSSGGITDAPTHAVLNILLLQYRLAGVAGDIKTLERAGNQRLALQLPFRTPEELGRVTNMEIRVPDQLRGALPPDVAAQLPGAAALVDADLKMEEGWLGSKTYSFRAVIDPAFARATEVSGLSVRVSLPGGISSTNGRVVDGEATWPGPGGWPRRLEVQSQVGIFGITWNWAMIVLPVLVLTVVAGFAAYWFWWPHGTEAPSRRRLPLPRRNLEDA